MMLDAWIARGERLLSRGEQRLGLPALSLAVGAALMVFAGLYASENFVPLGFGANYARLATEPFRFDQPDILQYRLFAPVVAHYLGLRGNLFPILTHGASLLLLATLYAAARRRAWRPAEAAALAATMATSINVLGEVHFAGMTDPISYLGLLGALLAKSALGYGLGLGLALLNHESNFFALPWLLACGLGAGHAPRERLMRLAAAAAAVGAFAAMRACLGRYITSDVPLAPGDYLRWSNIAPILNGLIPHLWLGVFAAYKLLWALPLLAGAYRWRCGARREAVWLALVVACALAQLLVAEDVTRLVGLAFPAILYGAVVLREQQGPERFARWMWRLLLFNLLVPTVEVFLGGRITPLYPLPVTILVQSLLGLPL
ncbi:MAG: hypothetical protein K8T26_17835 [Lentisphaerae bacterium]|nr:hypothetical protein [Lentisphaerota bacterium]